MTTIIPIKLSLANAYLVLGERPILVDTGGPGEEDDILAALTANRVAPNDLSLILHTHAHVDHAGSTAALARLAGTPSALHRADLGMAQAGDMGSLQPIKPEGWLFKRMVENPFPPFTPDVFVTDGQRLDAYGVAGRVVHTPGHTAGSISLLLDSGEALVGDVLMGGIMGGTFFSGLPGYHLFAEDLDALHGSLRHLLELGPRRWYVGHGGPLQLEAVARRFSTLQPAPA